MTDDLHEVDDERLVLGDLLSHVLDKGVVLTGDVIISVADIDLIRVALAVMLTSVESEARRGAARLTNADVPVLPDEGRR
ncbi:MAG TPA: gas vesicle protein [Gemmatimonadaceae bacterium]|nr:gas vesicle protein [Gemmatimonadaceae bacterium]